MAGRSFIPGLELSRRFYFSAVRPIMQSDFPRLTYSAGLLGPGSDVLGHDTPRSMDHDWGPRLKVFLEEGRDYRLKTLISSHLAKRLPVSVAGFPTNWAKPGPDGISSLQAVAHGPVRHRIEITTVRQFFRRDLGCDPTRELTDINWLLMPQQQLLHVTSGAVFHDGLGTLEPLRRKLRWFPDPIWRALLAAQWARIEQEEPFAGRCAELGDDLGSKIVTGRLVRDIMRLCFLMERKYAPYSKWLGTAFKRLQSGPKLGPLLNRILSAKAWPTRQRLFCRSLVAVAHMHNRLGITRHVSSRIRSFHGRPFYVLGGDRFRDAIRKTIHNRMLREYVSYVGSVDQFADSTDLNGYPERAAKLGGLFARLSKA